MRKKIHLMIVLLFSCTIFSHAFYVDLGKSVKSGAYYIFPEANVDDYGSGDQIYTVNIQFMRGVTVGDEIILPSPLPSGWVKKTQSTTSACLIDISSGATVAQVQTFLRDIKIKLAPAKNGNEIEVMLLETIDVVGREVYNLPGRDSWYEYVEKMESPGQPYEWWKAYNMALDQTFAGANGYLATITSAEENEFVSKIFSGKMAWLGGTSGDIRTALGDDIKLLGPPTADLNYWYWACGPEYGGDPEWAAFYKKKTYADPDPNPDPWELWGLPYDYAAWGTNQPDNTVGPGAPGGESYLHIGSYNNGSWNDYGIKGYHPTGLGSGKMITGFIVEYNPYIVSANAIVGFESTKNASIDGVYNNGTVSDPVKVVYGDEILYEITAVNASATYPTVTVSDVLPEGLEIIPGSISDGGDSYYDDYEGKTYINWWDLEVPEEGKRVVSYKATPVSLTTELMKNTALVVSEGFNPTLKSTPAGSYESQTDTTYHIGTVCHVTFACDPGGSISGGTPQIIDYGQNPNPGVTATPPAGREFVGWSYPAYTSVKGENKAAAIGIIDYDTITVYGDMELTAKWDFRFAEDTIYECTPPVLLSSGHDGLDYQWILPDGSSLTTEDIQAQTSGKYILHTNYGSMITSDTIFILFAFEENVEIENISTAGPKINKPRIFTVAMNPELTNVDYLWTFDGGGVPATSTADTVTVVYSTTGKKQISVKITATLGSLICEKTLTLELDIYGKNRNFFVDQHVSGGDEDGSSWQDAYRRIEDALAKATEGDCIWVARGEYTPPAGNSFRLMRDSIEIYGGFGAWEEYLYERNIAANPTVLRGSGNSVIVNSNAGKSACWDGFIIERGAAVQGGGVFNDKSSLTIANCIIRGNRADEGGGMYSTLDNPLLYNVEISGNTAKEGAAIYNDTASPQLTNVTISGNQAVTGGGMYNVSSNPRVLNSIIWGNKADKFSNIANYSSDPYYHYSIIGDSQTDGDWDSSLGTDGGQNSGNGPLFKIKGFDDKGNMQTGNYQLGASSPAIDRGSNRYVSDISVRWGTHLQSLEDVAYLTGFPNDLAYNERIINDRVDIGAYEYNSYAIDPVVQREVYLPYVEGLILNPGPGKHYVRSQSDFIFTVSTMMRNNSLDNLSIKTGNEIRDKEGVKIEKNEDGSVTVRIKRVTETLMITINGVSPTSTESVDGQKVWAYERKVFVRTDKQSEVRIYDMKGMLYLQQKVDAGETVIPLSQGFYTVQLGDMIYKIAIK